MNDIFLNATENNLSQIKEIYHNYPASSYVTFYYAKMMQELYPDEYRKNKAKWLLFILNRKKYSDFSYSPASDSSETKDILSPITPPDLTPPASQIETNDFPHHSILDNTDKEEIIDELIEKFSNNPPKIKYDPEKHDAAINYGKDSLAEDPDLISETLAIFYLNQGYPGKALKIYKKLCLQFPEKSCYFAAQIREIKNKKN
ncbi:MAG: hypothetical protein M0P38_03215 [Bacteroidales bacterium]|jgi:hypothetical protein|nr:hypothetical protein [Bacteroidales bacterium]